MTTATYSTIYVIHHATLTIYALSCKYVYSWIARSFHVGCEAISFYQAAQFFFNTIFEISTNAVLTLSDQTFFRVECFAFV